MPRYRPCALALALSLPLGACADGPPHGLESGGSDTGQDESPSDTSGSPIPDLGDDDLGDDGDLGGDGDGDPALCDPTASSWDPWIGGPCVDDLDCGYDGGVCLREDQGWPCGTCSLPCDLYCPDVADAPASFCVDQASVDPFAPDSGACLQQCDPSLLTGGGCRPGYSCALVERHTEPGTWAAACLPGDLSPPKSECEEALDAAGLLWVPAIVPLDHPATHPNLDCLIDTPVRLFSPINGVDYRYISSAEPSPILVSCAMALALHELGSLLQSKDAVEVAHIGTYNCRVIGGTDTLSEHSFAHAIDLGGFTLAGGQFLSVLDDWEDGVEQPVTFAGQWLKDLTDQRYDQGIFNIILTPEYNDAHDNHFHVDLTPGASFYE